MNVLSLFDGISCGMVSLERAGIEVDNYYSSEIDKWAIKVSEDNYPNIIRLGDVTKWRDWDIDWSSIDLVMGGSPCQGFSFAGRDLAFDDPRSKLFFVFSDILKHVQKVNKKVKFLLENVRMKEEYLNIITSKVCVPCHKINSKTFTFQNRLRYYWTDINYDKTLTLNRKPHILSDLLPDSVGVYTIPRGWNKGGVNRNATHLPTITTSSWQHNFFWVDMFNAKHKFTTCLAEEAQGLPHGYTSVVSDNQAFKLLGNGWTVDVIAHILTELKTKNYKK